MTRFEPNAEWSRLIEQAVGKDDIASMVMRSDGDATELTLIAKAYDNPAHKALIWVPFGYTLQWWRNERGRYRPEPTAEEQAKLLRKIRDEE